MGLNFQLPAEDEYSEN